MTSTSLPKFDQLDEALTRANSTTETSETHGILCGMVCATGKCDLNEWLSHILGDFDPRDLAVRKLQNLLMDMHEATLAQFADENFMLSLYLRSDDEPLDARITDLGDWCEGFLFGLSISGASDTDVLPENTQEVIADITEISRAGYAPDGDPEENEAAFMEIVEYLRVGALLIYQELNDKGGDTLQADVTLH